jgi:uncharacterized membrane protein (DUF2068 family)
MAEQILNPSVPSDFTDAAAAEPEDFAGHNEHRGGLLAIGLFKLLKSIFFFLVGVGALHLVHKDLAEELMRLARAMRFDPEGHIVHLALQKVDTVNAHRLREIGAGTFAYSALALTEGIGLVLEKPWAEYLTLSLTVVFLPWEVYEIVRHPSWFRFALLAINLAVLGYLLWILSRKRAATSSAEEVTRSS